MIDLSTAVPAVQITAPNIILRTEQLDLPRKVARYSVRPAPRKEAA